MDYARGGKRVYTLPPTSVVTLASKFAFPELTPA